MKMAFVYRWQDKGMSGTHWTNNAYRFFRLGLPKIKGLEYEEFAVGDVVDCAQWKRYDVVLFYSLENIRPVGLEKVDAIKVVRGPDPHAITVEWLRRVLNGGVDLVINHHTPEWTRNYLPEKVPYEQIIFGITKEQHKKPDWGGRKKDVLLTGEFGRKSFYRLRHKSASLQGVQAISKFNGWDGDNYPKLLGQYKSAIAACTVSSVYKYFEIPACGCLSFMEVNKQNGCDKLGFVDGENAIFINESNYRERIAEFVQDPENPKWRKIANKGRTFAIQNYENEVQCLKLLRAIEEIAA